MITSPRKRLVQLAALVAVASAASLAQATDAGRQPSAAAGSGSMSSLDRNDDGRISRPEAASSTELTQQFRTLDADRDGALDAAEFAQFEAGSSGQGSTPGSGVRTYPMDDDAPSAPAGVGTGNQSPEPMTPAKNR